MVVHRANRSDELFPEQGWRRVLFIGSKKIGLESLKVIHRIAPDHLIGVVTFHDENDSRSELLGFRQFCSDHNIPMSVAKNRLDSEQLILKYCGDLCVVVGWYWLIGNDTLDSVPGGFFALHNSLLPAYRGAAPLVWSIINGDDVVGFSIFKLTTRMDDGDVYFQYRHEVKQNDCVGSILKCFHEGAIDAFETMYPQLITRTAIGEPQDHSKATYCAARKPGDGRISWNCRSQSIFNFIRAQAAPYPGAYSFIKDDQVKIWKARLFEGVYYGIPGQVVRLKGGDVVVACGHQTAIVIQELEADGERRPASQIVTSLATRFR